MAEVFWFCAGFVVATVIITLTIILTYLTGDRDGERFAKWLAATERKVLNK